MTNNRKYFLMIILTMAILPRLVLILFYEFSDPGWHEKNVNEIEFYYDDVARSLLADKGFVHSVDPNPYSRYKFEPGTPFSFVPPLFLWIIFAVYKVFGPSLLWGKIFTALIDSSVVLMIFFIGKKIFRDNRVPIIGATLYAIYPLSIMMAKTMYYQVPMNVTMCCLALCLLSPVKYKNGIYTGIAFGLSSLAKPVTLPLLLMLPCAKCIEALIKKIDWKTALIWSFWFIFIGGLFLAPWTIRNYLVFNEFVPIQKGGPAPFFQGSKSEYIDIDVSQLKEQYGSDFSDPSKYSKEGLENHIKLFKLSAIKYAMFLSKKFAYAWYNTEGKSNNTIVLIVQMPFLTLAIIGLFAGGRKWFKGRNWYVFALIIFIIFIQVAIFPLVRYTLVIMPLVLIYSSYGLTYVFDRLFNRLKAEEQFQM